MDGKWCEKNWDCSRSTSISKTDSKSVQTGMSNDESAGLSNTENIQEAIGSSSGSSFGQGVDVGKMGTSVGGAAKDIIKNNKGIEKLRKRVDPVITPSIMFLTTMLPALLNIIGSQNFGMSKGTTQTVTQGSSWARNVGKSKGININNSTSFSIAVSETDNVQKPEYAKDYCGSWFAVPVIGLTCGMGAHGTLTRDPVRRETRCTLDPEDASFGHCFPYHYSDRSQPDLIKHKPVFVLRDCEDGFILPGEWQHPIFAQSFSPKAYVADHIRRFSFFNLKGTDAKPRDDQWIAEGRASNFTFTKTLGPEDHDIEICGRGKYCARHKLTDGNCYNIPRGYAGSKTAHIVSAKTTPGSCCVLFSRPECHGLAQVVKGDIPNLGTVGFAGQAHSMVCNIDEYCNPNRQDELQFTGVVEV
ncbi:hypothetical protein B0T17DRAFT_544870 [Bombardia bombarda]|uniref:Uncharacterized protein n=1 Tax=Bombardia bombarda TaxID=252184 RepID=A0AA39TWS5_9PEZI|nr:hypothetical protein B0T17DRAFT_544870 [Bombardia bombarda]